MARRGRAEVAYSLTKDPCDFHDFLSSLAAGESDSLLVALLALNHLLDDTGAGARLRTGVQLNRTLLPPRGMATAYRSPRRDWQFVFAIPHVPNGRRV